MNSSLIPHDSSEPESEGDLNWNRIGLVRRLTEVRDRKKEPVSGEHLV